jgi:hypothetical protein
VVACLEEALCPSLFVPVGLGAEEAGEVECSASTSVFAGSSAIELTLELSVNIPGTVLFRTSELLGMTCPTGM